MALKTAGYPPPTPYNRTDIRPPTPYNRTDICPGYPPPTPYDRTDIHPPPTPFNRTDIRLSDLRDIQQAGYPKK